MMMRNKTIGIILLLLTAVSVLRRKRNVIIFVKETVRIKIARM